jgi:hypothetical protein
MKRFASKLFVFLLLGAIINVAVAWGIAMMLLGAGERGSSLAVSAREVRCEQTIGSCAIDIEADTVAEGGMKKVNMWGWLRMPTSTHARSHAYIAPRC